MAMWRLSFCFKFSTFFIRWYRSVIEWSSMIGKKNSNFWQQRTFDRTKQRTGKQSWLLWFTLLLLLLFGFFGTAGDGEKWLTGVLEDFEGLLTFLRVRIVVRRSSLNESVKTTPSTIASSSRTSDTNAALFWYVSSRHFDSSAFDTLDVHNRSRLLTLRPTKMRQRQLSRRQCVLWRGCQWRNNCPQRMQKSMRDRGALTKTLNSLRYSNNEITSHSSLE